MKKAGTKVSEKAYELLKSGKPVTPDELSAHVGTGPYAAKHVWELRKLGHDIQVIKDGRKVVHYIYQGGPASQDSAEVQESRPSKSIDEALSRITEKEKTKKDKPFPDQPQTVAHTSSSVKTEEFHPTSFTIDPEFDSVDLSDFQNLR